MTTALALLGLPAYKEHNQIVVDENPVINEAMIAEFVAYLDVSENTLTKYEYCVKTFLGWMTTAGITKPQRDDILCFRKDMEAIHKPATVALLLVAVKLFFRFLADEGLYPNVADHIKSPKQSKGYKKDYFVSSQINSILDKIDRSTLTGKRDYALILLAYTGGLRTIEISRADVSDMRINGNAEVLYIQGKGRDEKDDFVKIVPEVAEAIREYLSFRDMGKNIKDDEVRPLFTSCHHHNAGKRLPTISIRWIIKMRMRAAGFDSERLTSHSLRHTAITWSLQAGATLQEVQQFARHSSINTTQIYAHNLERLDNPCEMHLAAALFNRS
jgi:integrase/recombinase XerC